MCRESPAREKKNTREGNEWIFITSHFIASLAVSKHIQTARNVFRMKGFLSCLLCHPLPETISCKFLLFFNAKLTIKKSTSSLWPGRSTIFQGFVNLSHYMYNSFANDGMGSNRNWRLFRLMGDGWCRCRCQCRCLWNDKARQGKCFHKNRNRTYYMILLWSNFVNYFLINYLFDYNNYGLFSRWQGLPFFFFKCYIHNIIFSPERTYTYHFYASFYARTDTLYIFFIPKQ